MVLREQMMKGVFKGDELKSNVTHLKKTHTFICNLPLSVH